MFAHLTFDPPAEFLEEELTMAWRTPRRDHLKEARVLQAQVAVRPNLVVNRRKIEAGRGLDEVAGETCSELFQTIPGISEINTSELEFKDGAQGVLLEYSFATAGFTVMQLHALRLDGDVLTSMAISTEKSRLSREEQERFRRSLASASIARES